jgi:hypothetical protein
MLRTYKQVEHIRGDLWILITPLVSLNTISMLTDLSDTIVKEKQFCHDFLQVS